MTIDEEFEKRGMEKKGKGFIGIWTWREEAPLFFREEHGEVGAKERTKWWKSDEGRRKELSYERTKKLRMWGSGGRVSGKKHGKRDCRPVPKFQEGVQVVQSSNSQNYFIHRTQDFETINMFSQSLFMIFASSLFVLQKWYSNSTRLGQLGKYTLSWCILREAVSD